VQTNYDTAPAHLVAPGLFLKIYGNAVPLAGFWNLLREMAYFCPILMVD
jgi:hypothetical protein